MQKMNLLLASHYYQLEDAIGRQLKSLGIQAEVTNVSSIDELEKGLLSDLYHFLVTEYSLDGVDIWGIVKLVNSARLADHALPIILVNDEIETEIPPFLLKAHGFTVCKIHDIATTLRQEQCANIETGYVRGRKAPPLSTLLVIEDDQDIADTIRYNLKQDYLIDLAPTGEDGLRLWAQTAHDLVLLDYMLPGIQGDKVLSEIMAADPNQPVIIMTAHDVVGRYKDLLLNGASDYLSKPVVPSVLRDTCAKVLRRSQALYQMQYITDKLKSIGELVWLTDTYLTEQNPEKALSVVAALKLLVPIVPLEDEQLSLLGKEF